MVADRKGVSELVSYVLLVVIAVGIAVLVYNYLSGYVPKDTPTCKSDISLVIEDAWCSVGSPGHVNVTLVNKGLFRADAVYIRFGLKNRKVLDLINEQDLYFTKLLGSPTSGLLPGGVASKQVDVDIPSADVYTLQVEPAVSSGSYLALCPQSMITQQITCS